jgi:hypothetical protein
MWRSWFTANASSVQDINKDDDPIGRSTISNQNCSPECLPHDQLYVLASSLAPMII